MFKSTVDNQCKYRNLLFKREKKNSCNFFKAFCEMKPLLKIEYICF